MIIPIELQSVLVTTPDTLGGSGRFSGTRVPVQALIDTLDGGNIEDFPDGWPDVTREQAKAFIRWEQNVARQTFGLELAS